MKRVDVVKKGNEWVAESAGKTLARAPVKTDAVRGDCTCCEGRTGAGYG